MQPFHHHNHTLSAIIMRIDRNNTKNPDGFIRHPDFLFSNEIIPAEAVLLQHRAQPWY